MYKGKKQRQEEAIERQKKYNRLATSEKIKRLDEKFGVSLGANKQRAKLTKVLNDPKMKKLDEKLFGGK